MFTKLWRRAAGRTHRPAPDRGRPLGLEPLEGRALPSSNVILEWNEILLQSLPASARVPHARNMAIVHVAMFDAVNAIDRSYEPYHARVHASHGASAEAAAAQAAHDTLSALFPARRAVFDQALAADLAGIPPGLAQQGVAVGQEVARQILALRADDRSGAVVTYTPPDPAPAGEWVPTPPDGSAAGAAHVPFITPFAVASNSQFRPAPPPALTSAEYAADVNEVQAVGAADAETADRDGNGLPDRTPEQTQTAMLWRSPLTNHQVWNRITQTVADDRGLSVADSARLFALLNMSLNDGLQTSFESKYHYTLWRPITAIQRADEDGNPATEAEETWTTLHPNTPPYPAYASNASTIGAACATVLAEVFGSNDVSFEVDWTPYNFPGVTRTYDSFWEAADQMAESRILGGIHFRFDCVAGQEVGRDVAGYVTSHYLLPREAPGASGSASPWHGGAIGHHPAAPPGPAAGGHRGTAAKSPAVVGAFAPVGGVSPLTLIDPVPVDDNAPDTGSNPTAPAVDATTPDDPASGGSSSAAPEARTGSDPTDPDEVLDGSIQP